MSTDKEMIEYEERVRMNRMRQLKQDRIQHVMEIERIDTEMAMLQPKVEAIEIRRTEERQRIEQANSGSLTPERPPAPNKEAPAPEPEPISGTGDTVDGSAGIGR